MAVAAQFAFWAQLLVAALLAMSMGATRAWAGDGTLRFQTLHTPDADIHAPEHLSPLAVRVAATLADARRALAPLFNERDRPKLQLSLDDYSDSANGWASAVPYDHVHLLAYPPAPDSDLGDHGDWVRSLVFHEYAHILHMGDVSGLPRLGNFLFGRRFLPNALLPRMILEGLATWVETRYTGGDQAVAGQGGRVGSAQFQAMLRAAVRDGTLPEEVGEVGGAVLKWPFGSAWYLYGSMLIDDLARRFGDRAIRAFMGRFGQQVMASGIQGISRQIFGASMSRLWRDACTHLRRETRRQWSEVAGIRLDASIGTPLGPEEVAKLVTAELQGDGTRLTRDGHVRGSIRLDPGGTHALVAHTPVDGPPRIERIDLASGDVEVLHACGLDCDEPQLSRDGRWLWMMATRHRQRVYLARELVGVVLSGPDPSPAQASGGELQLTRGLRGRSFSLSDDGRWAYGVAIRGARTAFFAIDLPRAVSAAAAGQPLQEADWVWLRRPAALGTVLDSPVRVGDELWWTEGQGGQRRAMRAPLLGDPPRAGAAKLVVARVAPGDPLLAVRDALRGGAVTWIADLQTFRRAGRPMVGALIQLGDRRDAAELDPRHPDGGWHLRTRTLTGLHSAALGATVAATVRHQGRGLDVWRAPPPAERGSDQALGVADPLPSRYAPTVPPGPVIWSAYNPLPTLRPRVWTPIWLSTGDGRDWRYGGTWLGAQASGSDAAGWAELQALGQLRTDGTDRLVTLNLAVHRWEPLWTLSVAYDEPWQRFRRGMWWFGTPGRRLGARIGMDWSAPFLRSAWSLGAALRWVQTWLVEARYDLAVDQDPAGPIPREPVVGGEVLADLSLGWGRSERYATSVRTERQLAWTLRGTIGEHLATGTQRVLVGGDTYQAWPLGRRRVLATQVHASWAVVRGQGSSLYSITGILPTQALAVLGLGGPTGWTVRGAPLSTGLSGDAMVWGSAQFSFPIRDLGRTLEFLPVYAGRLTGSLFVDAAAVGAGIASRSGVLASLGAEGAIDLQLGFALDVVLRVGTAWVPGPGSFGSWIGLGL